MPCTACGNTRTVAARLPDGPLCSTCYRKHPASFRPCTECGTTEHLYHHGLCTRCASRQHLLSLLGDGQGGLHPHAEAVYHLLAAGDPAWLMEWLTRGPAVRDILAEISQASQPPGHADRATQLLIHDGRRRSGVDPDLPHEAVDGDLAYRRIEQYLGGDVRQTVIVGAEAPAARNLNDGFGVLQPDGPLSARCRSGTAERLGPTQLRLPIKDLPDRAAECFVTSVAVLIWTAAGANSVLKAFL